MHRKLDSFQIAYPKIAIVGSGAVGTALKKSLESSNLRAFIFNSDTIDQVYDRHYDLLIYAGVYAFKMRAEQFPELDRLHVLKAADTFEKISAKKKILISTIDTALDSQYISEYGKNRKILEEIVLSRCLNCQILRLPALFGSTVKKNPWYDMIVGPENVKLTDSLAKDLDEENRRSRNEINILSTISGKSQYVWFNLDTILDQIIDLLYSEDKIRLCVSYDALHKDGLVLSHAQLKSEMGYVNVVDSVRSKTIDYSSCLMKQKVSFSKSDDFMNSSKWKKGVTK